MHSYTSLAIACPSTLQTPDKHTSPRRRSPTVTADQLLSFQPLPHPVPLEEAVEVLAELWELEEPF
jgi:hypothetical protein